MKNRISIRTENHEVLVLGAFHAAANLILYHHWRRLHLLHFLFAMIVEYPIALTEHLEPDRALFFIGAAGRLQLLQIFFVNVCTLTLAIRPKVAALADAVRVRTLVPIHPEPGQAVVDEPEKFFTVASGVRVLDAQD